MKNQRAENLVAAVEAVEPGLGIVLMQHRPDLLYPWGPLPELTALVAELRRLRQRG